MNIIEKLWTSQVNKEASKPEVQVKVAQKWIGSAQHQFASALEEAKLAEQAFDKAIQEKSSKVQALVQEIAEIEEQKKFASDFKKKVSQFLEH